MSFDPYHVWLSIPPNEQPPNHYRLLGIPLYEPNADVIESAADRQMQYLRTFQSGPHSVASQRLLNEVSTAKICLLTPAKKREYDQLLRARLAPPPAAPAVRPVLAPHPQPAAVPEPAGPILVAPTRPVTVGRGKSKNSPPVLAVWISLVAIAALVVAVVWFKSNQPAPIVAAPPKPPVPEVQPAPAQPTVKPPANSLKPVGPVPPKPNVEQPAPGLQVAEVPLRSTIPPDVPANTSSSDGISPTESRKRLPAPEEAALAEAAGKLDTAYGDEIKAAKMQIQKRALAQTFLGRALVETSDDTRRYALLRRTIDVANDAGSYDIAVKAIDSLSFQFEVDDLSMREAALDFADRLAKSPDEQRVAVDSWRELAKLAISQDNYDAAVRASQKAADVARKTPDKVLLKRVVDALDDIKQIKAASVDALAARDALQADPKDSAASAAWGKFCCLYKGDWGTGLPLLAAGSGDDLCELARQEQMQSNLPADQAKLGDQWWAAATIQKEPLAKKSVQGRAVVWYRRAVSWLPDVAQAPLRDRIDKYDQLESPFPLGEWVELLPMIDPARHASRGNWQKQGPDLLVQPGDQTRCRIPVTVDGAYDIELRFTLRRGLESNVVLPVGDRHTTAVIGGWGGRTSGLTQTGTATDQNNSTVRQHEPMRIGPQQRILCRVRPAGDKVSIEVDVNARPLIRWQGPVSSLQASARHALGLTTHQTAVLYHSVRLKLISGKATPL